MDLIAIPVHDEERDIARVLLAVLEQCVTCDVLVVDDGSADATPSILRRFPEIIVRRHEINRGYGAALRTAFDFAVSGGYDAVVTLDSDGQHDPCLIRPMLDAARECDVISGSRYKKEFPQNTPAPEERRRINSAITRELNACYGLNLTDAFCGFKAYNTAGLRQLDLTEDGYAMPLELWVQAACRGLCVREMAVPRVYLDPNRSFGANLDDDRRRLAYYQEVIERAVARSRDRHDCQSGGLPTPHFVLT